MLYLDRNGRKLFIGMVESFLGTIRPLGFYNDEPFYAFRLFPHSCVLCVDLASRIFVMGQVVFLLSKLDVCVPFLLSCGSDIGAWKNKL